MTRLYAIGKCLLMGIVVALWEVFILAYVDSYLPTNRVLHVLVHTILLMVVIVPFTLWVLKLPHQKPPPPP